MVYDGVMSYVRLMADGARPRNEAPRDGSPSRALLGLRRVHTGRSRRARRRPSRLDRRRRADGAAGGQLSALTQAAQLRAAPAVVALERYIAGHVPGAQLALKESTENTLAFVLPFDEVARFGDFFSALDGKQRELGVVGYGVAITDLEEVFLEMTGSTV